MQSLTKTNRKLPMKFISFEKNNIESWGVLADNNSVIDLGSVIGGDLKTAIAKDQLKEALNIAKQTEPSANLEDIKLLSPIPNPCLLYTSPSPRDLSTSRMPSSA